MISQTDLRILSMMIDKTERLMEVYKKHSRDEIESDYTLSDTIQYEFEKIYEDTTRLSMELRITHPELHIDDLRGIRNRVAHEYESVSLAILLDTIEKDIPILNQDLKSFIESN